MTLPADARMDVSPDGQRFLMIKPVEEQQAGSTQIHVVNWTEELKRLVPTGKMMSTTLFACRRVHMIDDLYETVGGQRTIRAATDAFYRRVLEDESLRHFFDSTDMAHLRARQSMFLSMLLGGRVVYTGKEIGAAHAQARAEGLTDRHFDAFLDHFRAALDDVGVKPEKADEVMKLLEAKRGMVLSR